MLYATKGHFLKNLRSFPAVIFKMTAIKKYHTIYLKLLKVHMSFCTVENNEIRNEKQYDGLQTADMSMVKYVNTWSFGYLTSLSISAFRSPTLSNKVYLLHNRCRQLNKTDEKV